MPSQDEHTQNENSELYQQILNECDAMARYAMASGLTLPGTLVQRLDGFLTGNLSAVQELPELNTLMKSAPRKTDVAEPPGCGVNTSARQLALVHNRLARIVAPAKPRTILLLAEESQKRSLLGFLGPVPLVRRLMLFAALSLISFVGFALSPYVDQRGSDIFTMNGLVLLVNLMFLLSAAGLGAAFNSLFDANRYIVAGTFDPKHESSYWVRIQLGLIAGIILPELIPIDTDGSLHGLGKPSLAMLGGFSAAVVYRILKRLVDTVESLVRGSTEDVIAANMQALSTRVEEEAAQSRVKLACDLVEMKRRLSEGGDVEELRRQLDCMIDNVIPLEMGAETLRPVAAESRSGSSKEAVSEEK